MQVATQLHTIVMLVGPTKAGKSTFAASLGRALAAAHPDFRVVSIDIGAAPSPDAVEFLFSQLDALTKWPKNHEFVIVDAPALDAAFRARMAALAEENGYNLDCVLFEFPHKHFFRAAESAEDRERIAADVVQFATEVQPGFSPRNFAQLTRLRGRAADRWESLEVAVSDLAQWIDCRLQLTDRPVAIIGDVHENVPAAEALLSTLGRAIPVLDGDWLDKGGNTAGAVALAERVLAQGGKVVVGNHESYAHSRINGAPSSTSPEVEAAYFTSLAVLEQDSALADRFRAVFRQALPYLHVLDADGRTLAYATHAPCLQKHIGKHHAEGQRSQRNHRLPVRTSENLREMLAPVFAQAQEGLPLHAFGHVSHASPVFRGNQVWLDTGAAQGGLLTALVVHPSGQARLAQVPGDALAPGQMYDLEGLEPAES